MTQNKRELTNQEHESACGGDSGLNIFPCPPSCLGPVPRKRLRLRLSSVYYRLVFGTIRFDAFWKSRGFSLYVLGVSEGELLRQPFIAKICSGSPV